jgi:hypothetical protein
VCAPDLGVGDDGWGRTADDVGGRPGGRGTVMVGGRGAREGAAVLELVEAGGVVAMARVRSVSGISRAGRRPAGRNAPGQACSRLPAPIASRSWRAFSSATWVRTPNSASAIPKRTTRWMAHQCARSGGRCNERQPSPRHSGQAVSRQAQQALGGQGGERSGARTRECVLREHASGVRRGTRRCTPRGSLRLGPSSGAVALRRLLLRL